MQLTQKKSITSGFRLPKPNIKLLDITLTCAIIDTCLEIFIVTLLTSSVIPTATFAKLFIYNIVNYLVIVIILNLLIQYKMGAKPSLQQTWGVITSKITIDVFRNQQYLVLFYGTTALLLTLEVIYAIFDTSAMQAMLYTIGSCICKGVCMSLITYKSLYQ